MRRPWLLALTVAGLVLLPWYAAEDGLFSLDGWWGFPTDPANAPALLQAALHGRWWLLPLFLPLGGFWLRGRAALAAGVAGLSWGVFQGLAIGPLGVADALLPAFPDFAGRQFGMGAGAALAHLGFLFLATDGLAERGALRGDRFVVGALGVVGAVVTLFVVLPVGTVLLRAVQDEGGQFSAGPLWNNLASFRLWKVAANSLLLALCTGALTTGLGLCFALAAVRTGMRAKGALRALSVLPLITPPFVLGLGLVLALGKAGVVTHWLESWFGLPASRYIYGFPGVLLAQLLAFTPTAFMVLVGVLEGISPTLEEAARMLRASPWKSFRSVTLPLMRPGLAGAFLVGFVESLADFGNPLVLGGSSFDVLSTEIYFAVAGAQSDVGRAAVMALLLLAFTLLAFVAQQRWVGQGRYVTVSGKGDAGLPSRLPPALSRVVQTLCITWALFTAAVYGLVLLGGFVPVFGRNHSLTLMHYRALFALPGGTGWDSLGTSLLLAGLAAPLTAGLALLTAYLLERQRFKGRGLFEFATLLAFAVPGTVVGVAYLLTFNAPPLELTGTALVILLSFVARNMPVGIRAGTAALSQIDPSLDEASLTLGAGTPYTLRRVTLPLLRPALLTATVYGFVRAMTAVSAAIFLVSADHSLATTFILGRIESGEYGRAIAYATVLMGLMLLTLVGLQRLIGRRELGRREAT